MKASLKSNAKTYASACLVGFTDVTVKWYLYVCVTDTVSLPKRLKWCTRKSNIFMYR